MHVIEAHRERLRYSSTDPSVTYYSNFFPQYRITSFANIFVSSILPKPKYISSGRSGFKIRLHFGSRLMTRNMKYEGLAYRGKPSEKVFQFALLSTASYLTQSHLVLPPVIRIAFRVWRRTTSIAFHPDWFWPSFNSITSRYSSSDPKRTSDRSISS